MDSPHRVIRPFQPGNRNDVEVSYGDDINVFFFFGLFSILFMLMTITYKLHSLKW